MIGRIVGIDLGTTYSALAVLDRHGQPVTVQNAEGETLTPSAALIDADGSVIVGREALRAAFADPQRVARNFKRQMGERYYDRLVAGRRVTPVALSAMVLRKMVQDAQARIGPIAGAVITVPAYFGDTRRKATEDAGRVAGITVLDIINEPTAAALAAAFVDYAQGGGKLDNFEAVRIAATAPATTLVFDLGGGTLDVTIIRIGDNRFEVVACGGEVSLGGIDWDTRLVDAMAKAFIARHNLDPREDAYSYQTLYNTCEEAKRSLSSRTQVPIVCHHAGRMLRVDATREQFNELTADLLARAEICVELLLQQAGMTWEDIDEVLPVGGSTRMPMVQQMLERMSGKRLRSDLPATELVAHGAAVHGAILFTQASRNRRLSELFPDLEGGEPTFDELTSSLSMLSEEAGSPIEEAHVTDVNSHSLGVVTKSERGRGLINSIVIPKDTPLPALRSRIFGLEEENQRQVVVRIVEGEALDATACTQVGECVIAPLPPGLPKAAPVEVVFNYNTRGRIHVRAVDRTTGMMAETVVNRDAGLSETELKRLGSEISGLKVI